MQVGLKIRLYPSKEQIEKLSSDSNLSINEREKARQELEKEIEALKRKLEQMRLKQEEEMSMQEDNMLKKKQWNEE